MNEPRVKFSGLSIVVLAQIVFIVLKLCGAIDWDWFWVLFPIIGFICLCFLVVVIALGVSAWEERKS